MRRWLGVILLGLWLNAPPATAAAEGSSASPAADGAGAPSVVALAFDLFSADRAQRAAALARLADRGESDVVAALIHALRFLDRDAAPIVATLRALYFLMAPAVMTINHHVG